MLEHACFLGSALLFWWTAIAPSGRRRLARGADVLYVFTGGFQGAVLGALFVFASSPLFPFYSQARTAPWGLTPLSDQQLAGAVMWVPSGTVSLLIAGMLFVRWLGAVERVMRRAEGRAMVDGGARADDPHRTSAAWSEITLAVRERLRPEANQSFDFLACARGCTRETPRNTCQSRVSSSA